MNVALGAAGEAAIAAAGWTLLHFLWQGAVAAAGLAAALTLIKRASVHRKYALACAVFFAMALWPATTFLRINAIEREGALNPEFVSIELEERNAVPAVLPPLTAEDPLNLLGAAGKPSGGRGFLFTLAENLQRELRPLLRWVVAAWLAGVSILAIRLGASWARMQRLRSQGTRRLESIWEEKLRRLAAVMRIRFPVHLLESNRIETPSLFGWLRPLILMPASAMTGLEPGQVEALLAHELAHVRRHDYLVNLFQSAIETLLFYHPAVWWMSREMRRLREECCDDMAAEACGNRIVYARSLEAMESLRGVADQPGRLALGSHSSGQLLGRIRRIVGQQDSRPSPSDRSAWWILAAAFSISAAALALSGPEATAQQTLDLEEPVATVLPATQSEKAQNRLTAFLTSSVAKAAVGEPIKLRLEAENPHPMEVYFDDQIATPYQIVEVKGPDGKLLKYVGIVFQTAGSAEPIPAKGKVELWNDVDVTDMFLFDKPGRYVIVTKEAKNVFGRELGAGGNRVGLSRSNSVVLDLTPGKLPESKALLSRLLHAAPEGWRVSSGFGAYSLMHSPTGLKADVTTIELWFTRDEPEDRQRWMKAGQTVTELGECPLGRGYVAAPPKAKTLWPEHLEVIRAAVRQADTGPLEDKPPAQQKESDPSMSHAAYGKVTDADGNPVADAEVSAHTGIGTLRQTGSARTNPNGEYRLEFGKSFRTSSLTQRQFATITVRKPGWSERNLCRQGSWMLADAMTAEEDVGRGKEFRGVMLPGQPVQMDFVLVPATTIRGVVVDENGDPLDGVRVSLTGKELPPSSSVLEQTRTDKGGRFALVDVPTEFEWQFLIEPAKAGAPWNAWASPPLRFGLAGGSTIRMRSGQTELFADHLELQVVGQGVDWRKALADAESSNRPLKLATNHMTRTTNPSGGKIQASVLRLALGH